MKAQTVKLILLLLISSVSAIAQQNSLRRKISFDCHSCDLEIALRTIGQQAGMKFSYDATLIQPEKKVTINAEDKEVGKVLTELLGAQVKAREVGNHVILIRNSEKPAAALDFPEMTVTGIVLDGATRKPLTDVTIYEIDKRKSALTDTEGSFTLILPSEKKLRGLSFCKSGYLDTVVFIRQQYRQKISMLLYPESSGHARLEKKEASLPLHHPDSTGLVQSLVPREALINAQNLDIKSVRPFQVSLIPYIGTNWKVSGSATNRFSLNILAGYSGGLDGVEIGGLLNMTRNVASGVQIGGLANYVEGNSDGVQIGGLVNFVKGNIDGVQIGGLVNYSREATEAVQVAGLVNYGKGRFDGVRIAGLVNISNESAHGVQIAGLFNMGNRHTGGFQLAGLVNYARVLSGVQLGFINVASTVERGTPIGFFSYVSDGYHLFEISANEIFYANLSFKSGTKAFYNIFQVGIGDNLKLHGAYGIGTSIRLSRKMAINFESTAGFVLHPTDTVYHGLQLKVIPTVEYRFAKRFALFAGPSWNFFLWSKGEPSATTRGLSPYDFYFKSTENASIQMWIGGVVGIRL
jgi:hypothetical protein